MISAIGDLLRIDRLPRATSAGSGEFKMNTRNVLRNLSTTVC